MKTSKMKTRIKGRTIKGGKTRVKAARRSKRGENAERDAKILQLTKAGKTQREVAKIYHLTPQRVNQIVAKAG